MGGPDFDLDLSKAGSASFQLAGSAGTFARSSPAQHSVRAGAQKANSY